jgi:hypothetical protein
MSPSSGKGCEDLTKVRVLRWGDHVGLPGLPRGVLNASVLIEGKADLRHRTGEAHMTLATRQAPTGSLEVNGLSLPWQSSGKVPIQ